ncbi:hypothetical protein M9Y10_036267 [Tritrichomonas musculus]|uniref:Uncharacterized protein n=1 Tax=Tritrichomonas musculus TaxID=1915356 RepID=A0ABR2GVX9_9EUKA
MLFFYNSFIFLILLFLFSLKSITTCELLKVFFSEDFTKGIKKGMLVTPSPQMLMHYKSEHFGNQLLSVEFISQDENQKDFHKNFSQLILDINFAYSTNRSTLVNKQKIYTTSLLCQFSLFDSPCKSIYLALVALRNDSQLSAIKYLIEAAQDGSTDAMNLLGKIYEHKQIDCDLAFKWFTRAYRLNSINSFLNIGNFFLNNGDDIKAIYFLKKHYDKTHNIFSILTIAQTVQKMGIKDLSLKLFRFCAANGLQDAIEQIITSLGNDITSYQELFQWLSIGTRFNIVNKNKPNIQCSDHLRANYSSDFSIPLMSSINKRIQPPEPFVQTSTTKNLIQHKEPFQNQGIWKLKLNKKTDEKKFNSLYFFPSESKTNLLLLAFHYCSKDQTKRNLLFASAILKKLQFKTKFGLFNSQLWVAKTKSKNPNHLMKCGFICCLLNDYSSAFHLFQNSSNLGNGVSSLMCGIILYHGLMKDQGRNVEQGLYYFSSVMVDPIALIYTGTACNELEWIERAAQILQCKANTGKMYDDLGDFFFEGVKMPRNLEIAKLWYGIALKKYEENGFDTNKIIKKISNAVFDEMSIA